MLLCILWQASYTTSLWPYQKVLPHLLDPNDLRWHKFVFARRNELYHCTVTSCPFYLCVEFFYELSYFLLPPHPPSLTVSFSLWVARPSVRRAAALRSDSPALAHVLQMTLPLHSALFLRAANPFVPTHPTHGAVQNTHHIHTPSSCRSIVRQAAGQQQGIYWACPITWRGPLRKSIGLVTHTLGCGGVLSEEWGACSKRGIPMMPCRTGDVWSCRSLNL